MFGSVMVVIKIFRLAMLELDVARQLQRYFLIALTHHSPNEPSTRFGNLAHKFLTTRDSTVSAGSASNCARSNLQSEMAIKWPNFCSIPR